MKKKPPATILRNIGCCLTMDSERFAGPLGILRRGAVVLNDGKIAWVGADSEIPKLFSKAEEIPCEGALITPGLIDCHTHLVFAGSRADEFFLRIQGWSYEEIAQGGGGIRKTVAATRAAKESELSLLVSRRLDGFLRNGVTTVEVKSGYGLSTEHELRHLRVLKDLKHSVSVVPTFMGAHIIPDECRMERNKYVDALCEEMLPKVKKENLSSICDVFVEEGAFTLEEGRKILARAKSLGFSVKVHADQLTGNGGAELAAEFGALSADHLEHVSEKGMEALREKNVIAVLLPGAVFSLAKRTYPPARELLERGVKIAISTDCNPGTSLSENLPLMMSLAALEMKLTIDEIWPAVTWNAALAMGIKDRGKIVPGFRSDIVIWNEEEPSAVAYHYGAATPKDVISATPHGPP